MLSLKKIEKSLKIKTAAAKPPQNETLNTTMFLELFLEMLSYLCEISGGGMYASILLSMNPKHPPHC